MVRDEGVWVTGRPGLGVRVLMAVLPARRGDRGCHGEMGGRRTLMTVAAVVLLL